MGVSLHAFFQILVMCHVNDGDRHMKRGKYLLLKVSGGNAAADAAQQRMAPLKHQHQPRLESKILNRYWFQR